MFSHKSTYNKQNNTPFTVLTKIKTSYDKLEKEMTEAPKDYDSIKMLVENDNNNIAILKNINNTSKQLPSMGSHQKKNKSKK